MSTNSEFDNVFHAIFFVFKGHVDSVWSRKTKPIRIRIDEKWNETDI